MAAQKGNLFLLSLQNAGSPVTYTAFAEARSTDLTINNGTVDVTHKGSSGKRQLLEGASITSFSASMSGVVIDSAHFNTVVAAANANTHVDLKIASGAGDSYTGEFAITSFKRGGEFNGEETFTANFESAGAITYAAGA